MEWYIGECYMNVIKIDLENLSDANELLNLADSNENIDVIQEKNFNGDITTLELYISMTLNVIALIVPVLIKLIKYKKIESLVIDGDKIEVKNISEDLAEKIIFNKLKEHIDK